MKRLLSKRVLVLASILVAVLFVVRVPASHLRNQVVQSIGAALGRNVEIGSLHVKLLPRPGFELENLVIHDDPQFGAEPLLRAADVSASLQLMPLLHGRVAIAGLSLNDASVNLTRNSGAAWNLEDLLLRTSKITVAPTASGRHFSRPQFPYIEATSARINFKTGNEKTHFALTDAKFALWQDSENTWGMRLQARPIRTDANLTDTGLINISGSWQRATVLHETPVQLSFEWKQAQIGQISKLIYGIDKSWRGNGLLSAEIGGTPQNLRVTIDATIDDFRRQDVFGGNDLRLTAHCGGKYSFVEKTISDLDCVAPSGNGLLEVKGSATASGTQFSSYDLRLVADQVPAQSVLAFVRHTNANLARDLVAQGRVDGSMQIQRMDAGPVHVEGSGEVQELQLGSESNDAQLGIGTVPVSVTQDFSKGSSGKRSSKLRPSHSTEVLTSSNSDDSTEQPQVEVGPVNILLGRSSPVQLRASLSRTGYQAWIRGEAGIKQLLQSARSIGIPAPAVNAEGISTIALQIAGGWTAERPQVSGTAQLHSVLAQVRGTNGPISIAKANLIIDEHTVQVLNLNASAAGATWHGSLRIPRPCAVPSDCQLEFHLTAPQLSAAAVNRFLNPALQKTVWYKWFASNQSKPRYLLQARANGTLQIDNLLLGGNANCSHFTSGLRLDEGRLKLSGMSGQVLDGNVSGDWSADFTAKPPIYRGSGSVNGLSLADVSDLMNDAWIDGIGETRYEFTASGWTLHDLLGSADLEAEFSLSNGVFPHIVLVDGSTPLRARSFAGAVRLHEGELSFDNAKLQTAHELYLVTGTASLKGDLDLKIASEGTPGLHVSGTVLETRVSANSATAASLKP